MKNQARPTDLPGRPCQAAMALYEKCGFTQVGSWPTARGSSRSRLFQFVVAPTGLLQSHALTVALTAQLHACSQHAFLPKFYHIQGERQDAYLYIKVLGGAGGGAAAGEAQQSANCNLT